MTDGAELAVHRADEAGGDVEAEATAARAGGDWLGSVKGIGTTDVAPDMEREAWAEVTDADAGRVVAD